MMSFVVLTLIGLALVGGTAVFIAAKKRNELAISAGGLGFAVIGLIVLAIMSTTIVPARTVGINLSFGKPVNVFESGFHVKTPWSSVEKLDLAVQNDVYNGDRAIDVRLTNSAKAKVDASIQWQVNPEGATDTYLDYRSFESIQANLIDRNFRAALNEVMASYDPLDIGKGEDADSEMKLAEMGEEVRDRVSELVGNRAEIRSVTIPIIHFDEATQNRIDALQTEFANTGIAEQKQNTARAEAEANRQLEESLSNEVLTSKCLDIIAESGQSPLGCFPGTSADPVVPVQQQ